MHRAPSSSGTGCGQLLANCAAYGNRHHSTGQQQTPGEKKLGLCSMRKHRCPLSHHTGPHGSLASCFPTSQHHDCLYPVEGLEGIILKWDNPSFCSAYTATDSEVKLSTGGLNFTIEVLYLSHSVLKEFEPTFKIH